MLQLTDDMHKEIISAFGLLPPGVRVLWKFNGALPPAVVVPSNVRVESGWVAQNDILGHIKVCRRRPYPVADYSMYL